MEKLPDTNKLLIQLTQFLVCATHDELKSTFKTDNLSGAQATVMHHTKKDGNIYFIFTYNIQNVFVDYIVGIGYVELITLSFLGSKVNSTIESTRFDFECVGLAVNPIYKLIHVYANIFVLIAFARVSNS